MAKKLKITLVRSTIDRPQTQKDTVKGLGLTKLNRTVIREDSHAIRGMVRKVQHLVAVEPAE
jgi:large subunit ribosomal protein L30